MLLNTLINASIQGGLIILVLLIGLKLFPSVHPKVRVWLWRLVFLKFAFCFLPFAAIPLKVLPQAATKVPPQEISYASSQDEITTSVENNPQSTADSWMWAWVAGIAVSGVFALLRFRVYQSAVTNSSPSTDESLLDSLRNLVIRAGLKKTPRVLISRAVPTAVVVGSRNPTILLPTELQKSGDLHLVLAHEVAHVAHRDLEWNAFTSCMESLFFFHPLMWVATRASHQAQEAAADAAAIRLTNASPKRYGEMLVRATILSRTPSLSAGLSVGASTGRIRKRLQELKYVNTKQTIKRSIATAVLACAVIAMTPAYQLKTRDTKARHFPATYTVVGHPTVGYAVQSSHYKSHTYHVTTKGHKVKTSRSWRVVRGQRPAVVVHWNAVGKGDSGTVEVAPTAAVAATAAPTIARGVRAPEAIEISVAPATARAVSSGVTYAPQRASAWTVTRPKAINVYVTPATAARATTAVAADPASVDVSTEVAPVAATGKSISISSVARPAVASGVATSVRPAVAASIAVAPQVGRTLKISVAHATAQRPGESYSRSVNAGTTVFNIRPPATHRYKVSVRRGGGIHRGVGIGTSSGSGAGSGSGSGHGAGSASGGKG